MSEDIRDVSDAKASVVHNAGGAGTLFRWVALIFCFFGFMVAYMQRLCLGPLAPFIQKDFGLTKAQLGLLSSSALIGYVIVLIPAGVVCDRWGVRWTLSIGQLFAGVCVLAMIFASDIYIAAAVMFGAGLGLGLISPSTTKGVVEWFPLKERALAMGIKQTGLNSGGFVCAISLPIIALAYGWRIGFVVLGIVAIVSGALTFFFYKNAPQNNPPSPQSPDGEAAGKAAGRESWLKLFRTVDMWLIIIGGSTVYAAEFAVMTYFVLYLKEHLLIPVVAAGFLLGCIDIGGLFGKPIGGYISDRIFKGRRKPTFILLGVIAIIFITAFSLIPPGTPQWVLIPCTFIFGFAAVGGIMSIFAVMISEYSGKDNAAKGFSVGLLFCVIAQIVGVPIFGHISDITHAWTWSWIYLIGLATVGTLSVCFLREDRRRLSK